MTGLRDLKGTYTIDPAHSSISFVARHAMITKVRGTFDKYTSTLVLDGDHPEQSSAEVSIDVSSVDTRDANRDAHLKSPDFFDVEHYPVMTFKSTKVELVDDQTVNVTGDLTIRDVTKPVTIPFTFTGAAVDPFGNQRVGFEGQVTVNRKDWNLNWNAMLEAGGVLVADKVNLEFDVSAIKQA